MSDLVVDRVTKRYGAFTAVDAVSFTARPGRILGVLGPNGAGKTSTLRMVTGITLPDEGTITFDGRPVGRATQQRLGFLPEERGLYRKLRVGEQLVYFGELRGLSRADARQRTRTWLERLSLHDWAGRKTEELSKGMQQKVQFAASLLHEPDLVVLDEPFSGLDPVGSEILQEIVLELRKAGRTVLFASHRMEQVEQLVDDICLIARGRVVLAGPLRDVKAAHGRDRIRLGFEGDDAWLDTLAAEDAVEVVRRGTERAEVRLLGGTDPARVLDAARAGTRSLHHFEVAEPSLVELFRKAVSGTDAESEARKAEGAERAPAATP
jgi:ABC-2 type transport system ATP-binding protein